MGNINMGECYPMPNTMSLVIPECEINNAIYIRKKKKMQALMLTISKSGTTRFPCDIWT